MDYVGIKKIKKYSNVVPILTDGPSERENKKYSYFTSTKLANRPLKKIKNIPTTTDPSSTY